MKSVGLRELYDQFGFVVVPHVLSADEVRSIRALCDRLFQDRANHPSNLLSSDVLRQRELWSVALRGPVVRALKAVLGDDYTMFSDLTVPRNVFGVPRTLHRDADSEGYQEYLLASDYRFVKCGVFLQDNDREWGGGVTVTPSAHRFPLRTPSVKLTFRVKKLRDLVALHTRERWVDIKAGDFLCFDSRLPHQSSMGSRFTPKDISDSQLPLPPDRTKYVLYWDCSTSAPYVDAFLANSVRRAATEPAFRDYVRLSFPNDYPPEFVESVAQAGIRVASLPPDDATYWQSEHARFIAAKPIP